MNQITLMTSSIGNDAVDERGKIFPFIPKNDIKEFKNAINLANHGALLIVDCIASFGCERIEMDPW